MNKYEYSRQAVSDMYKVFMELSQDIVNSWDDENDVLDMLIRDTVRGLQCRMESYYNNKISDILKAEHDELEDMIKQFYGPVMAACGKDGE